MEDNFGSDSDGPVSEYNKIDDDGVLTLKH